MKTRKNSLFLFLLTNGLWILIATSMPNLRAQELNEKVRTWTSSAGSTITASLVKINGNSISLKTEAGKKMTVKLVQLSASDQQYVNAIRKKTSFVQKKPMGTEGGDLWYKKERAINVTLDNKVVIQNVSLKPGAKKEFQIEGIKSDSTSMYLGIDIGPELMETHGLSDFKSGRILLEQTNSTRDAKIAVNGGGGTSFNAHAGKIEMKLTNRSKKNVRIVVLVAKNYQD